MNHLLFADIGNSSIDLLKVNGEKITEMKYPLKVFEPSVELSDFLADVSTAYLSSVNSQGLKRLLHSLKDKEVHILDSETMKRFASEEHYTVSNLDILGADLFCDIVADPTHCGQIIIDLGTASKILYLDSNHVFYGAMIFPSPTSFPKTLFGSTDQLEDYHILENPPIVSLKTEECISSGSINGVSSLIAGTVNQIKKNYHDSNAKVYLTGGNAPLVKDRLSDFGLTDFIQKKNLVIDGLIRIYQSQRKDR